MRCDRLRGSGDVTELGAAGGQLSVTDGTRGGTFGLSSGVVPGTLADVGGRLHFARVEGDTIELWRSDGTSPGTERLGPISPFPAAYVPSLFTAVGSRLFFYAADGTHRVALFASDGGAPVLLRQTTLVCCNDRIVDLNGIALVVEGGRLLGSDGTPGGATILNEASAGIGGPIESGTRAFFTLYEVNGDGVNGLGGPMAPERARWSCSRPRAAWPPMLRRRSGPWGIASCSRPLGRGPGWRTPSGRCRWRTRRRRIPSTMPRGPAAWGRPPLAAIRSRRSDFTQEPELDRLRRTGARRVQGGRAVVTPGNSRRQTSGI